MKVDPAQERLQRQRIADLRASRDNAAASAALDRLGEAARGDDNLMPHLIRAVEAYATLGEIADALRGAFGEQSEPVSRR